MRLGQTCYRDQCYIGNERLLVFLTPISTMCWNICILLWPINVCDKVHWTVNIVCPFRGLYPSMWPAPWDTIELCNPSPNAICCRVKGSQAYHSCESKHNTSSSSPGKKRVEILPSGYLQAPSFSMSAVLGCKITIKHLLQSHEESICPFDASGHQEARACGVA